MLFSNLDLTVSEALRNARNSAFSLWPRVTHSSGYIPRPGKTYFSGTMACTQGGLTCVAQGPLAFGAGLVIPLARGRVTLDVDLHAVLVVPLVVGLVVGPVLSLLCESLVGSHPGPLIIDLSDPNPVVRAEVWDDIIEVSDFILVLDGH